MNDNSTVSRAGSDRAGEGPVGLRDLPAGPVIPVGDLERSRRFYETGLGFAGSTSVNSMFSPSEVVA
jgi:hypothetical protein